MRKSTVRRGLIVSVALIALLAVVPVPAGAGGYSRGIVINVDGVDCYLAGAPDGPSGAFDVSGHEWVQTGPDRTVGKHCNTGSFGAPSWWSSDAPDGELLFVVRGIIDTWSPGKAAAHADRGYVHYRELKSVADATLHPTKIVCFKHIAHTTFTLHGGPHPPDPGIEITPGAAFISLPNWETPCSPE